MKRDLILSGSFTSCGRQVVTDELLDFISSRLQDIELYKLQPKPGSLTGAAIDWQAFVNTSASIITIGQVLWFAYEKFIKPIHEKNFEADLYIHIRTEECKSIQFMIGRNFKDKKSFLEAFEKSIRKLEREPLNIKKMFIAKEEIRRSDVWIRIKNKSNVIKKIN
jgi:hypothetical protein